MFTISNGIILKGQYLGPVRENIVVDEGKIIDIGKDLKEGKIIDVDEYLGDDLTDYKFYCFNGEADVVLNCIERNTGHPKFYFFDKEWNLRRLNKRGKDAPERFTLPKPKGMDEMFEIAAKLSIGLPYARVDLYNVDGKIYFGEITLFPASGFDYNRLPEADLYFGEKIVLPVVTK